MRVDYEKAMLQILLLLKSVRGKFELAVEAENLRAAYELAFDNADVEGSREGRARGDAEAARAYGRM